MKQWTPDGARERIANPAVLTAIAMLSLLPLAGCDFFVSSEAKLARAEASLAKGEARAALIDLRSVVQKDPQNIPARIALSRALLQLGEVSDADLEISSVVSEQGAASAEGANASRSAEIGALRADIKLALGKFADLLKLIDSGELAVDDGAKALYRGRALLGLSRAEEAKGAFQQALTLAPASTPAKVGLANAYAMQGNYDAALREVDKALGESPQNVDARFLRAMIHLRRGLFREAEAELVSARGGPQSNIPVTQQAQILAALAESRLGQGKLDEAGKAQQELAAIIPGSAATLLLGARITLAKGGYAAATADLQRLVLGAPDFLAARMLLGAAHLAQGHLQQAEAELSNVVQRAPDNIEARKLLARARLQLNRPDAALSVLTPALEGEEQDADLYSLLGAIRLRLGGTTAGIEALEQSVRASPDDVVRKLDLAAGYIAVRQYDKAVELLRAVPANDQNVRREGLLVAAIAGAQGQRAARTELERLLDERPSNVELMYLAAAYFQSQREFERARNYLERALEVNPKDLRGLSALANLQLSKGDLPSAEATLRRALAIDASNAEVRIALAEIAFRRNDRPAGIAVLEEGRKAYPESTGVRLALARAYFAANDVPRARAAIDEAMASKSAGAELSNRVGAVLLEASRFDEAVGRFRDAADAEPDNVNYWLNLARAQLALDQSVPASESVARALALRPDWLPAVSAQVLIDLRAKRADKALATVQGLRKRNPREPNLAVLEGDVRMASDQFKEAAQAFAEAEQLKPSAGIAVKLHEARRAAGLPRPEASLVAWLGIRPEDATVRMVLAQFYMNSTRLKDAARELETINRERPNNPAVLNNLAWLYQETGDARAEATARRAHELAPANPAIADTYGWILFSGRDRARALPVLEAAARVAANNPEIQYHYAAALAAAGRKDEARETLRKAMAASTEFRGRRAAENLLEELDG